MKPIHPGIGFPGKESTLTVAFIPGRSSPICVSETYARTHFGLTVASENAVRVGDAISPGSIRRDRTMASTGAIKSASASY